MPKIYSKKVECTPIQYPPYPYNAEIKIDDNGEFLFIHVYIHSDSHYTVAKSSIFDFMTQKSDTNEEVEFIEEYQSLEEAKNSKYYTYFEIADKMIDDLIDNK